MVEKLTKPLNSGTFNSEDSGGKNVKNTTSNVKDLVEETLIRALQISEVALANE